MCTQCNALKQGPVASLLAMHHIYVTGIDTAPCLSKIKKRHNGQNLQVNLATQQHNPDELHLDMYGRRT